MPKSFPSRRDFLFAAGLGSVASSLATRALATEKTCTSPGSASAAGLDVRCLGAAGDGHHLDTAAINTAIRTVAARGGGIVRLPAGDYLASTLYLKDGVTLLLENGATLRAAPPGDYGIAEPNRWDKYQDYGHDHWTNSLICGIGARDIAIAGTGVICGNGLSRGGWTKPLAWTRGTADKVIALKECRNVRLSGFTLIGSAHMGVLATGVEGLTISGLTVDTIRDGIDIDCCERVAIEDCSFNTPHDDSIAIKSSDALGYKRITRDIAVRRCFVTGAFAAGSFHDGSRQPIPATGGMKARIKLGTESCWGFSDIRIEDCVFRDALGIPLLTVDGGALDNVAIRGITLQNIQDAPFFLRLGERLSAPAGAAPARLRQVAIDNVRCYGFGMPIMISGVPGHPIEDVGLTDIELVERPADLPRPDGGWMPAAREWSPARSFAPPERAASFPEDGMFGAVPAKALFARHVERLSIDGLRLRRVNTETAAANREPADRRPFFWLHDVADARFRAIAVPAGASNPICWSDKDNAIAATSSDDLARAPDWQTEPRRGRAQKVNTIAD